MDTLSLSGRIKALEKKFQSADMMEKLAHSKDLNEFAGLLERSFYRIPQNIRLLPEVDDIFGKHRELLSAEMRKVLPDCLYLYFALKHDFYNLGLLAGGNTGRDSHSSLSHVDFHVLRASFGTGNYSNIPPYLRPALSLAAASREKSSSETTNRLKNLYHEVATGLVRPVASPMIGYFIRMDADFSNISVFIQKQMSGVRLEKHHLSDAGNIKKERFLSGDYLWKSVSSEYGNLAVPVDAGNYESGRYRVMMEYMSRARAVPNGIEPVFFFFAAREAELEQVRRLAVGKLYNIEPEILMSWGTYSYQYDYGL
jgi:hypothetical protein